MLAKTENLVLAGHRVREMGPRFVVIKKSEHGAMFFSEHETYVMPAFPTEKVIDPTGAGDSFAGGFFGYLDGQDGELDEATLRRAMGYGTVLASFNVEEFGTERVARLSREEIDERFEALRRMTQFDALPAA
jgi:sugar/nucleoside kinase (ribokinase family)